MQEEEEVITDYKDRTTVQSRMQTAHWEPGNTSTLLNVAVLWMTNPAS